ncbi:MAG: hypothetical protein ACYDG0_06490, partial [Vulcanimicrobiaceae bacterium]
LASIASPRAHVVLRRGKAWSDSEGDALRVRYGELAAAGETKEAIVAALAGEFGRGSWSIRKRLKIILGPGTR